MRVSYYFKQFSLLAAAFMYILVVLWGLFFIYIKFHNWFLSLLSLLVGGLFTLALFSMNKQYTKRVDKGIDGENVVRKELEKLPSNYLKDFDFVDGKHGNTDVVVVGPTGIWIIEVKNISWIDIDHDKYLGNKTKQTFREVQNMEKHLYDSLGVSYQINPVLVFTNPKSIIHFGFNKQNEGVFVIDIKSLLDLLQNQSFGHALSEEECVQIHDAVKKYTSIL